MNAAIALFKNLADYFVISGDEDEWGRVYSSLFEMPDAPYTTFVKLKYFRELKTPVQRFQDIPEKFKTYVNPVKLFVSYKWEAKHHPDQSKKTLEDLLRLTENCDDNAAIWWDYCSLPQRNDKGEDDRSRELKEFFKYQLTLIPLVIMDSQCLFLWSHNGIQSGWCCFELLIAQVLLQHLNRMIYTRRSEFKRPPLFVAQVCKTTVVETDLIRFDHEIVQKMYCTEVAIKRHQELITWLNDQLNGGTPTPYSKLVKQVTPELIAGLISEHKLAFTNGADAQVVSRILFKIYRRLSFEPFNKFKWDGQQDFFSMWHYVKGCLGNCLVPKIAYWF